MFKPQLYTLRRSLDGTREPLMVVVVVSLRCLPMFFIGPILREHSPQATMYANCFRGQHRASAGHIFTRHRAS